MAEVSVLEVALYDEPIGTLTLLPGDQTLFAFHQDYIDDPAAYPEPFFQGPIRGG